MGDPRKRRDMGLSHGMHFLTICEHIEYRYEQRQVTVGPQDLSWVLRDE